MRKELTYILGAGASFESIPVVKSFPKRFQKFNDYLLRVTSDTRFGIEVCESFRKVHDKSKQLLEAFKSHQSFDTYFKKLFHTGHIPKIFLAKKILNLYFLWEHLSKPTSKPDDIDETNFWKQSSFDKRYDALIAGLLKPINGKAEPYCPVNFITWNYDLNLFLSLKNYFSPDEKIGDFLRSISVNGSESIWKIDDKITVINMNGFFYSTLFSNEIDLSGIPNEIHELIKKKLNENYLTIDYEDKDATLVRFAWESDSPDGNEIPDFISLASDKIRRSENIVVIGYTFPLYNRLVDFEFFNGVSLREKIVNIQDPNAIEIAKSVIGDFSVNVNHHPRTILKEIANCDSFFVPSDIYKYKGSLPNLFN